MLTEKIFAAAQMGAEGILVLLIFLSIASVAIMFQKLFSLWHIKNSSKKMQDKLEDALHTNNLEDLEYLGKEKDSLEGKALSFGLRHVKENGSKGLAEVFNSYALMEKPRLEKGLSFLATVGSNAPFIGLLGTVLGIMKAFKDLGLSQGNMSVVMTGIAEALVATGVGLFVAIPAVVAYNFFQKQVKDIIQGIEIVKELSIAYANTNKREP